MPKVSNVGVPGLRRRGDGRLVFERRWREKDGRVRRFQHMLDPLKEGRNIASARKWAQAKNAEIDGGTFVDPRQLPAPTGPATLHELFKAYGEWAEAEFPRTWATRRSRLKRLKADMPNIRLTDLSRTHLIAFVDKSKRRLAKPTDGKARQLAHGATINRHASLLKSIVKWGNDRKWLSDACLLDIRRVEPEKESPPKPTEIPRDLEKLLIDAMPTPAMKSIVRTALETGLRLSNVVGLRKVDIKGRIVTVPAASAKTDREYRAPISAELATELQTLMASHDGDHVFPKTKGRGPYTPSGFSAIFRRAVEAAGLKGKVTFKDTRDTAATRILRATSNIAVASKVLGHSNVAITARRYAAIDDDDLLAASDAVQAVDDD